MGRTSNRLHAKLTRMAAGLDLPTGPRRGTGDAPDVEGLIREGFDPVHAVYIFIQHISSHFAERVSRLPEMKAFAKVAGAAEDEYLPSGPPMSPLTGSYFTCWALYDLRFGPDGDTVGRCQIDANDLIRMNPDQLDALRKLADSRMGVYEHLGPDGPHVRLRELLTGDEYVCHVASGYRGDRGDLWYVRLLPPLVPALATYHVAFTTPYVLVKTTRDDWAQFLQRAILKFEGGGDRDRLRLLMKYGPDPNYWNEFVFKGYHHHQSDAIFLAGIPDMKATLPHA